MRSLLKSLVVGAVILAVLVAVVSAVTTGRRVMLIAQSEISVGGYPDPNRNELPLQEKLTPGQQVKVLSCDQLKAYRAVHVKLENGFEGYVIRGKYQLRRYSLWSSIDSPVSFSCSDDWP